MFCDLPNGMTHIRKVEFRTEVDMSKLKAAVEGVRDAVQSLDAKIEALNEVDVPVEAEVSKDSAERIAKATRKAERITAANKPSPSYRAADPQASER